MVSKTIVAQVTVGSNPTPSATNEQVRGRILLILSLAARNVPAPWHGIWHGTGRRTLSIRERQGPNGTSYQLVVYAGRDSRGRDEYARRTLTGVSRREATKAHAQLLIDVEHGRTDPSRSLTLSLIHI